MKRFIVLSLMVCISFLSVFSQRSERILEEGWKFARGRYASAEKVNYDDKLWSSVTVPHDYAILGPFDRNNDLQDVMNIQNKETKVNRKTGRTGGLPYDGEAWYRCHFRLNGNSRSFLYFDGVMSEATVFVNGQQVAFQPNGYAAFQVEITSYAHRPGKDNVLAIKLDSKAHSSRWYPGAGIFREVRLIETGDVLLSAWNTKVITKIVGANKAEVSVDATIVGEKNPVASSDWNCWILTEMLLPVGKPRCGRVNKTLDRF